MGGKLNKRKIDDEGMFIYRDVIVTDDWYPCFDGNKAGIALSLNKSGKNYTVIFSAYGADDFGMVMKFNSSSCECAHDVYQHWKKYIYDRVPDGVNVEWFYEHGFYHD